MGHSDFRGIEKEALQNKPKYRFSVSLGGWGLHLYSTRKDYIGAFRFLLMQKVIGLPQGKRHKKNIYIYIAGAKNDSGIFKQKGPIPYGSYGDFLSHGKKRWTLITRCFRVFLYRKKNSVKIVVFVKESPANRAVFKGYLQVLIHKILFLFDTMLIHSSSIRLRNKTYIFIGERGAGKSTICLKLAKEGAEIIAEDHTLIRRSKNQFFAMGYEDLSRIAKKSEKYIFNAPIKYKIRRIGGFLKKEFPLKKFFSCKFYREFPVDFIFFMHTGKFFKLRKMPRQEAVIKLMKITNPLFRFYRPQDYDEYLDFFYSFMKKAGIFDLERSKDIRDLDKMGEILKNVKNS